MAAIQGRNGRFQVNGVVANVEQWSGELSTDRVDATGFEDQIVTGTVATGLGRTPQVITDGLDHAVVNVKGYVDAAAMPASMAQPFIPGQVVTNIWLVITKATMATRSIRIANGLVLKINYQAQVREKIMFDLNIESCGLAAAINITHPT